MKKIVLTIIASICIKLAETASLEDIAKVGT